MRDPGNWAIRSNQTSLAQLEEREIDQPIEPEADEIINENIELAVKIFRFLCHVNIPEPEEEGEAIEGVYKDNNVKLYPRKGRRKKPLLICKTGGNPQTFLELVLIFRHAEVIIDTSPNMVQ